MNSKENKSIIRYAVNKVKASSIRIITDCHGIDINHSTGALHSSELCPLAAVLYLKWDELKYNEKMREIINFPSIFIKQEITKLFEVESSWFDDFIDGIGGKTISERNTDGFSIGKWAKNWIENSKYEKI